MVTFSKKMLTGENVLLLGDNKIACFASRNYFSGFFNSLGQGRRPGRRVVREWGKYHCAIDLLSDWSGLVCFPNKNKIF
jgi:hypothetical protein